MSKNSPIYAALIGAGPLGINLYKYAKLRHDILISQVIDIDPALKGRDMVSIPGWERPASSSVINWIKTTRWMLPSWLLFLTCLASDRKLFHW
jgi:hypothetical protein